MTINCSDGLGRTMKQERANLPSRNFVSFRAGGKPNCDSSDNPEELHGRARKEQSTKMEETNDYGEAAENECGLRLR